MINEQGFSRLTIIYMVVGVVIVSFAVAYALLNNIRSGSDSSTNSEVPLQVSGVKSINEIRDIAGANLGEGISIVSIELEEEDAGLIYKVKLSDGTVLFYLATSGQAITDPSKDDDDKDEIVGDDDAIPADFVAKVSLVQARSIAEAKRPGKTIKKIEMEVEEGVVVYSVRFTDSGRVDIDATTGEIVRVEAGDGEDSSVSFSKSDDDQEDEDSDDESVEVEVKIEDNQFTGLSALTANKEARIKIHNEDEVSHTFTISALGINVTILADSEKEVRFTPTQTGTFTVKCTLHNITSTITVN